MAQRYGRRPSEILDPRSEWPPYYAFCLDEALSTRAALEEGKRWRDSQSGAGKDGKGKMLGDDEFTGALSGQVGVFSPEDRAAYLAGGGVLPDM